MKNINITRSEAISIISNILRDGCAIPWAFISNADSAFGYVRPNADNTYEEVITWLKDMEGFRIVPSSEVSDEFSEMLFDVYDVCVEFTNGDYSEQYLLWDINNFKD